MSEMDELQIGAGTPFQEVTGKEATAVRKEFGGKCSRCGRALKRVFLFNGIAYGPVCVRKVGAIVASEASRPTKVKPVEQMEPTELEKFLAETPRDIDRVYNGEIEADKYGGADHKVYTGRREIDWRLDLANHSPTGLCWGYGGSGPAQCSLAILADYLHDDAAALSLYQDFKHVIASFNMDNSWSLTGRQIEDAITKIHIQRFQTNSR